MSVKLSSPPRSSASAERERRGLLYDLWFQERARRRATWLLGALSLLFILFVAFFSVQGTIPAYDRSVVEALQGVETPPFPLLSDIASWPGYSPQNAVIAGILCVGIGLWLHWKVGAYLAAITLIQGLLGILLKFPIRVERPMGSNLEAPFAIIKESSFPSGHTMMFIVLYGFTVYLLWRYRSPGWLRWLAFAATTFFVVMVGPARLHEAAHWLNDVLAAYLMGFFLLLLSIEIYERWLVPRVDIRPEREGP